MTPYYADDWLTVYAGDCRAVLPALEAESVDCIVTSPPYWGLRDYGTEGQLGLEPTPELYVANLVGVFRDLRRVLKPSGTCWLNLGDSLNGKQLVGIPWRVAFALQADGWWLRSDIIWSKPNPMPESVTDRPTKAHEYLFLLTKSARYFYDADAVREPQVVASQEEAVKRAGVYGTGYDRWEDRAGFRGNGGLGQERQFNPAGRNLRSVWTIATRPYPGAHFAVFPPELPERCIKAGSSERGVCPECGAPWERLRPTCGLKCGSWQLDGEWRRTSPQSDPVPATILDPFAGSGTVGLVANRLSRRAILIDLNPDYITQQMRRNAQTPLGLPA